MFTDFEIIEDSIYLHDDNEGLLTYAGEVEDFELWCERTFDVSNFEYNAVSDDGEGNYSNFKKVDWSEAKYTFHTIENLTKYYNEIIN